MINRHKYINTIAIIVLCTVNLLGNYKIAAQENVNRKEMQEVMMWMLANYSEQKPYKVIDIFTPHKSNDKLLKNISSGKIYFNSDEIIEEVHPSTREVIQYYRPIDSIIVDQSEYNQLRLLLYDTFYWDKILPNPDMLMTMDDYKANSKTIESLNQSEDDGVGMIVFYIVPPIYIKQSMMWYFPKIYKMKGCLSCISVPESVFITQKSGDWQFFRS